MAGTILFVMLCIRLLEKNSASAANHLSEVGSGQREKYKGMGFPWPMASYLAACTSQIHSVYHFNPLADTGHSPSHILWISPVCWHFTTSVNL